MAAISSPARGHAWLLPHLRALLTFQRFNSTIIDGGRDGEPHSDVDSGSVFEPGFHKWRKLDSRHFGIKRSMISAASWTVLKILQSEGFEAYLVGGCVRDLILKRIPKDFDVITTAALPQIRKQFHRCIIVGHRFPICRVNVKGSVIEVSSFETVAKHAEAKDKFIISQMPAGCDKQDVLRWRNCMHRDFTINSLFFDPFVNKIYDYSNALMDLSFSKLRTLLPARMSFKEDCARILRGLRLAARLNLSFAKETEIAIRKHSVSITSLNKSRIMMELNYMLAYGAAGPSLCLLQRYNLLEIFFPFHAAHLTEQCQTEPGQDCSMLMKLLFNMDLLLTCDRPADSTLWLALLVFHLSLIQDPQHALVVLTFASVLYYGNWNDGVKHARQHAEATRKYTPEILDSYYFLSDDELVEKVTQFAALVKSSVDILTDTGSLLDAMYRFPGFPCSGFVFVSQKMGLHIKQIFEHLVQMGLSGKSTNYKRKSLKIDYDLLGKGAVLETRFILGRIIMDTMVPGINSGGELKIKEDTGGLVEIDSRRKLANLGEICYRQLNLEKSSSVRKDDKMRKLIGRSNNSSENATNRRQQNIVNWEQNEMAEREKDLFVVQSRTECLSLGHTSRDEKDEACQLPRNHFRTTLEDATLQSLQDDLIKETKVVHDKKYQHYANVQKGTSMEEHHLPQEQMVEQKEGLSDSEGSNADDSGFASERKNKYDLKKVEQKGSPLSLSSLFK